MYTKHYYNGSSRIASRIGGGFNQHNDLNNYSPALDHVQLQNGNDYTNKAQQLRNVWSRNASCAGLDHNLEYAYSLELNPLFANPQPDGARYFYHNDHLGSSAYITTENGYATQFLAYMPFGETLSEQQNSTSYYAPFKFSAKEKDIETGYSYFGARYYSPELSVWLGVDPMSDKYPSWSTYNYCLNNPVMLIDPDGRNPKPPRKITEYCFNTLKSHYNRDGQSILNRKGSALAYLANTNPPTNTCAIRMSEALNLSNYNIPKSRETPKNVRIQNGKKVDSGNFVLDAASMGNYLTSIEKPSISFNNLNSIEKINEAMKQLNALGDINGIIVLTAGNQQEYGATGHVDLIYSDFWGDLSLYGSGFLGGFNDLDSYLQRNIESNLSLKIWILDNGEGGTCE